jgi:pimeloyl-ACP methyl ester carboxylesterase
MVLLHGLLGHMHDWDDVLDGMEGSCRAIAPELPVFDPALGEVSIPGLARWVVALLDALELDRVIVGGNSLGGHVALEVALRAPARVSGLVLAGSSGLFERGFARGVPHRPSADYVRDRLAEVFHDPALVSPAWVAAVQRSLGEPAVARRLVQVARAARRSNLADRLPAIAVPALLVWGADDRITPPDVAVRFHALLPAADLVWLRRCGHAPMIERPGVFAASLRAWLEETRPRRGPAGPRAAVSR